MEGRRRWEEMEMDCLVHIFQRLSLEDLALGVPFVCKAWLRASKDSLCWKVLNFRHLDFMPWSEFSKKFVAQYGVGRFSLSGLLKLTVARSRGSAVELKFPLLFGASLQDIVYASDECPRLKTLVLPNLSSADEPKIPQLVGKCRQLEQLDIESKPSCFTEMVTQISLNCARFSGLTMAGSIKEEDATTIVNHLPRIKLLNLSRSFLPREQLLDIINGCRELQRLTVNNCIGFAADEEICRKASGIKVFEHADCKLFDESAFDMDECDPLNVLLV